MKTAYILLSVSLMVSLVNCGKKESNQVPIEQITPDYSNDYRYIFREKISSEKEKAARAKKDDLQK